jgi:pantothenate kinase
VTTLSSVRAAAEVIASARIPDTRMIVGIVGSPGAGKSTIATQLVELLSPDAVMLAMDGYHLPQSTLVKLGRRERMGAPDTFDVDGFRGTLAALHSHYPRSQSGPHQVANSGLALAVPGFDRIREEPVPDALRITPEFSIVIVEGNYLLLDSHGWGGIAAMLDLTFFIEVDHETRIERLVARHERFGKSPEDARDWALGPDESNARLIEQTASLTDHRIRL